MASLHFDDHSGFHRDVLGMTVGGGLGATASWVVGASIPLLGAQPIFGTLLASIGAGVGLGVSRGKPLEILLCGFAGFMGALAFHLVPGNAPLLGALMLGAAFGLALSQRQQGSRRWGTVLGCSAMAMLAMLLTGGPGGSWRAFLLPSWVAASLGGAAHAFLIAYGSVAGHMRMGEKKLSLGKRIAALPKGIAEDLRSFPSRAYEVCQRIHSLLAEHHGDRALLNRIAQAGDHMAFRVVDQIERWHDVERSIDPTSVERLSGRIEDLQQRIDSTQDEAARRGYMAARDALTSQLELHKRLAVGRERLNASLHHDLATLERLHLTLVNLKSADAQRFSCEVQSLLEEVSDLSQEVDILADVSDALASLGTGALSESSDSDGSGPDVEPLSGVGSEEEEEPSNENS